MVSLTIYNIQYIYFYLKIFFRNINKSIVYFSFDTFSEYETFYIWAIIVSKMKCVSLIFSNKKWYRPKFKWKENIKLYVFMFLTIKSIYKMYKTFTYLLEMDINNVNVVYISLKNKHIIYIIILKLIKTAFSPLKK